MTLIFYVIFLPFTFYLSANKSPITLTRATFKTCCHTTMQQKQPICGWLAGVKTLNTKIKKLATLWWNQILETTVLWKEIAGFEEGSKCTLLHFAPVGLLFCQPSSMSFTGCKSHCLQALRCFLP